MAAVKYYFLPIMGKTQVADLVFVSFACMVAQLTTDIIRVIKINAVMKSKTAYLFFFMPLSFNWRCNYLNFINPL